MRREVKVAEISLRAVPFTSRARSGRAVRERFNIQVTMIVDKFDSNRMKNGIFVRLDAPVLVLLQQAAKASNCSTSYLVAAVIAERLEASKSSAEGMKDVADIVARRGVPPMRRSRSG